MLFLQFQGRVIDVFKSTIGQEIVQPYFPPGSSAITCVFVLLIIPTSGKSLTNNLV